MTSKVVRAGRLRIAERKEVCLPLRRGRKSLRSVERERRPGRNQNHVVRHRSAHSHHELAGCPRREVRRNLNVDLIQPNEARGQACEGDGQRDSAERDARRLHHHGQRVGEGRRACNGRVRGGGPRSSDHFSPAIS